MNKKIVITGVGVLSPIAIGREAFWEGLFQGKTGFRPVTLFDTSPFRVNIAGEITDFDALSFLGKKGLRDLDRSTRLICSAAKLAIDDSRVEITEDTTHSMGVSIGTTFGSLHSISQFDRSGLIDGPRFVNPSHFPNTVINSPASQVSIKFKIKGFNTTISTGFCASLDAVSYAADFIRLSRADVVLAGGVEELCEETFMGFHNLECLSGTDGSEPICCPFDARRNGTILSEGAAVLVLEDEKHALNRDAVILARVLGYGNAFDPSADRQLSSCRSGIKERRNPCIAGGCPPSRGHRLCLRLCQFIKRARPDGNECHQGSLWDAGTFHTCQLDKIHGRRIIFRIGRAVTDRGGGSSQERIHTGHGKLP